MFYTRICDTLRLEEKDYFGLIYIDYEHNRVRTDFDCVSEMNRCLNLLGLGGQRQARTASIER